MDTTVYLVEKALLEKLKACASRLSGGSDAMRDEGNCLWALIWKIEGSWVAKVELKITGD